MLRIMAMRHLKGLMAALAVYAGLSMIFFLMQGARHPAWWVIAAILAYRVALGMSMPFLTCLVALPWALLFGTIAFLKLQASPANAKTWFLLVEAILVIVIALAVAWRATRRSSISWKALQWIFWSLCLANFIRYSGAKSPTEILISILIASIPAFPLGLLAWHEAKWPGALERTGNLPRLVIIRKLPHHFHALMSRRGTPLAIRMFQGWVMGCYGVLIGMITSINFCPSILEPDYFALFLIEGGFLGFIGAWVGRKLNLTALSAVLLALGLLQTIPFPILFWSSPELFQFPDDGNGIARMNAVMQIVSVIMGTLSATVMLWGLISWIVGKNRHHETPMPALKRCFTLFAFFQAINGLFTFAVFLGFSQGALFWTPWGYTYFVIFGIQFMPFGILALTLGLEDRRGGGGMPLRESTRIDLPVR